jgi:hypothetical protein
MDEKVVNLWQKLSAISGLVAAVVIPVVLALVGNWYSQAIKEREIQGRYVELALSILKEPPDRNNQNIRNWALQVIDRYSGVPLDVRTKEELAAAPLLPPEPVVVFDNGNKEAVFNRPPNPTKFKTDRIYFITQIRTYHWNNGHGATPGKISLEHENGARYGPWEAGATAGHGGVLNVNWNVFPNITLPPGEYRIVDSEPETWSHNSASSGSGFAFVKGNPLR